MLEDRTIEVLGIYLETVLAENWKTVISRNVTNTRMRDFMIFIFYKSCMENNSKSKFYGMHLWQLQENVEHWSR